MANSPVSELTLSRIWQDGLFTREMRTVEGHRASVVYGGVWTHQNGPDFRDAMVEIDGRLLRGAVELHLRASDWQRHGHQHDPAYDNVILHAIVEHDLPDAVHGPQGEPVATVVLTDFLQAPLAELAERVFVTSLGALGSRTCLPTLANGRPDAVRDVLRRAGWRRMSAKQLRFAQELERLPAGEVLYRGLLDGMGLMHNREGMAAIGERLPLALIEATCVAGKPSAIAALLGIGGFLPLAPAHAELADVTMRVAFEVEQLFAELTRERRIVPLAPTVWSLNRVRPTNHPVRRLASLGALIEHASADGLLATVLGLPLDDGRSWRIWLESVRPAIGRSRADQLAVNVLAPFMAAYADATGDDQLAEQVGSLWEVLPGAADDSIAKATLKQIVGEQRFRVKQALESQGLHEIGRNGCRQVRCFECPIAALAVMYEPETTASAVLPG
ncbi:MAG TPA: DUF2851 family protein [Thermomicrobiales bacterium]|nr:DUF2851 family protein [Thermomicrobiales bacterium]